MNLKLIEAKLVNSHIGYKYSEVSWKSLFLYHTCHYQKPSEFILKFIKTIFLMQSSKTTSDLPDNKNEAAHPACRKRQLFEHSLMPVLLDCDGTTSVQLAFTNNRK